MKQIPLFTLLIVPIFLFRQLAHILKYFRVYKTWCVGFLSPGPSYKIPQCIISKVNKANDIIWQKNEIKRNPEAVSELLKNRHIIQTVLTGAR